MQCGIQALNASSVSVIQLPSFLYTLSHLAQEYFYKLAESNIHSEGCLEVVQNLFRQNLSVILGFGIGLLVFQLFNIMLAGGIPRTKCVYSKVLLILHRASSGYPEREGSYETYEAEREKFGTASEVLMSSQSLSTLTF